VDWLKKTEQTIRFKQLTMAKTPSKRSKAKHTVPEILEYRSGDPLRIRWLLPCDMASVARMDRLAFDLDFWHQATVRRGLLETALSKNVQCGSYVKYG